MSGIIALATAAEFEMWGEITALDTVYPDFMEYVKLVVVDQLTEQRKNGNSRRCCY